MIGANLNAFSIGKAVGRNNSGPRSWQYSGTSFSVAGQELNPRGITWDGLHFWVVGTSQDTVYQYTSAGVYTGTSFSVVSQAAGASGIAWDNYNFWVVGFDSDAVYKYSYLPTP